MVGVDAERAETYLRLLAEAEVSLAVGAGAAAVGKPDVVHAGIWRMVVPAWVLVAVGAVRADAAETILADLQLALQARCLEAVANGSVDASSCVVPVPGRIDAAIATSYLDRKYPAAP